MSEAIEKLQALATAIEGVASALEDVDTEVALQALELVYRKLELPPQAELPPSEIAPAPKRRRARRAAPEPVEEPAPPEAAPVAVKDEPEMAELVRPKKERMGHINGSPKAAQTTVNGVVAWVTKYQGSEKSKPREFAARYGLTVSAAAMRYTKVRQRGLVEPDPDVTDGWRLTAAAKEQA